MRTDLKAWLLAGAAIVSLTPPAFAASAKAASDAAAQAQAQTQANQAKLDALQQQLQDLNAQVQTLKQAQADADTSAALGDLKRSTSDQYVDLNNQIAALPKAGVDNGRLQITSADGRFSAALRGLFQFDTAYYGQSHAASLLPAAYGPDLGSGSNFRRVYLGLSGRLFGDWTYNLNGDFGGSGGTETPAHIQSVYLEFDGLAPWAFRVGAFPPPASVEDATSAGDTIFIERNAPSDLQRNIAGGDGRDAFSIIYADPTIFGALSYTGNKVQDGAKALAAAGATATANFDEQQALVGRLSWLPIATPDVKWLVGVNGTHVFKFADLVSNGLANLSNTPGAAALSTVSLSDPPELTVDSNGIALANTGALPAKHLTQWGVESALQVENFYGQAGYYGFEVTRSPIAYNQFTASGVSSSAIVQPSNNNFSAWYAQATWILTGESRTYNASTGAFAPPKPAAPFSLHDGTWGAFEIAARYSDLDLNDNIFDPSNIVTAWTGTSKTYTYYNTVRGGDQHIATLGVNWYPNSVIRFALNYELIQNSRLQSTALPAGITVTTAGTPTLPAVNGGQNAQAIALRAQLSL
jgi:phosphate-selective porin OprO/OprP